MLINLKILTPERVIADQSGVLSIIAKSLTGFFGLLPQRLDCVAALQPRILTYKTEAGTSFVAVDQGVLVKAGRDVLVSVRHATCGSDLATLHATVRTEFLRIGQQERDVRAVIAKMESGFVRRFMDYAHEH